LYFRGKKVQKVPSKRIFSSPNGSVWVRKKNPELDADFRSEGIFQRKCTKTKIHVWGSCCRGTRYKLYEKEESKLYDTK
jgi:hypothetical protein